jgi:hypothetical protein
LDIAAGTRRDATSDIFIPSNDVDTKGVSDKCIDELRIYGDALTAPEIASLHNAQHKK